MQVGWQGESRARFESFWYSGKTSRRRFIGFGTRAATALGAALLVPAPWRPAFGQARSYKVGTLQTLSGPGATIGRRALAGLQLAVERINRESGFKGRPVELVVADDRGNPGVAVEQARRLLVRDRIDVHVGADRPDIFAACLPVWEEARVVNLAGLYRDVDARPLCAKHSFKTSESTAARAAGLASFLVRRVGRRWRLVVQDYSRAIEGIYTEEIRKHGGVTSTVRLADLRSLRSEGSGAERGGVLALLGVADGVKFLTEARELDLPRMFQLAASSGVVDMAAAVPRLSDGVLGIESYLPVTQQLLDSPYHRRFLTDAARRLGELESRATRPDRFVVGSFEAMGFLRAGIFYSGFQHAQDSRRLVQTLEGLEVKAGDDFPQGDKVLRREDHQGFMNLSIFVARGEEIRVLDVVPRERLLREVSPRCRVT
jgi:branched-chain amino acid transport system substrate-binding protein